MTAPPRRRGPTRPLASLALLATTAVACAGAPAPHSGRAASPHPSAAGGSASHQRPFTLVASGDVLPHDSIIRQARADAGGKGYDFRPMLAGAASVVSHADLAICHMETVYGDEDGPYTGYPEFVSPPQVADALAATGYDACSTASNHTLDDGRRGVAHTLGALDRAGVAHAGSGRTAAEAERPALLRAGGARVAHLAYTYGTNDIAPPQDAPWTVRLIDRDRVLADARSARKAGADIVVVSLHWGTEWQQDPDEQQLTLSQELTASRTAGRPDVDLILGTHAHVPQAYEKVNGTWVVLGMGDQIAGRMINNEDAYDPRGNEGTLARFTFAPPTRSGGRWTVRKAEFVPQWFDTRAGRVVNVPEAVAHGRDLTAVRDRLRAVVLSRKAAEDGLRMGR